MKVRLYILQQNLDIIKSGKKKREWRKFSEYNKKLLFIKDGSNENKWYGNPNINEIEFVVRKTKEAYTVKIGTIRLIKFSKDTIYKDENFSALSGQFAIEIVLL